MQYRIQTIVPDAAWGESECHSNSRVGQSLVRDCVQSHSRLRGFTLFEVIIALALSLALLSAVYSALDLHWKYTTAGQAEVQQSQLARALLRKIESDLRCLQFQPASTAGTAGGATGGGQQSATGTAQGSGTAGSGGSSGTSGSGGSSGQQSGSSGNSSQSSSSQSQSVQAQDLTTGNAYLLGNPETLLIQVSKPARQLSFPPANADPSLIRKSDLQTVAYFLAVPGKGGLQGLLGSRGTLAPSTASAGNIGNQGLARLEGDRFVLKMADSNQNTGLMAARSELLAAEVTAVQFEYFNGSIWSTAWDSTALGGLPRAVAVRLEFAAPVVTGIVPVTSTAPATVYRLVIPIPLATVQPAVKP